LRKRDQAHPRPFCLVQDTDAIVRKQSAMWEDEGDGLCRDKTGLEEMIPTDGIPASTDKNQQTDYP
jgi:hypothetical protein